MAATAASTAECVLNQPSLSAAPSVLTPRGNDGTIHYSGLRQTELTRRKKNDSDESAARAPLRPLTFLA